MEAAKPGQSAETTFSHVKEGDTGFKSDGLRDFLLYRDLGIAKATGGKVVATLVRANKPPEEGTSWRHACSVRSARGDALDLTRRAAPDATEAA
jgi:hypothetical protein